MKFFKTIKDSVYSPTFYSHIPQQSFGQSLRYFLVLILFLTLIQLVSFIRPLFFVLPSQLQGMANELINCFPKDLEIRITNGQLSINVKEPYFIKSCSLTSQAIENSVVIDTKTPFSSTQFNNYKTAVWVTKDSVFYKKNDFENRSYTLTKIKDLKLTKDSLNLFYQKFSPYFKFVGPILLVITLIGIYLLYSLRLVYLVLLASIIWLLAKILNKAYGYGQSYKVGLYAITLGLIVELLIGSTNRWTHFYGFPFIVSILTLSVILVNLFLPKRGS